MPSFGKAAADLETKNLFLPLLSREKENSKAGSARILRSCMMTDPPEGQTHHCPQCEQKQREIDKLLWDLKHMVPHWKEACADYEEALGPHPTIPNGQYLRRIAEMREKIAAMEKLLRQALDGRPYLHTLKLAEWRDDVLQAFPHLADPPKAQLSHCDSCDPSFNDCWNDGSKCRKH